LKMPTLAPLFFSVRLPTLLARFWRAHAGAKADTVARRRAPLSFIVFRLDALGDVVMTTPLFRELKRAWPKSRCTVVVQNSVRSLLVTNPHVDEVLSPPGVKARWLPHAARNLLAALLLYRRYLRERRFDVAISPRWEADEHLATMLCLLANATERIGYCENVSPIKQRLNRRFDPAFSIRLSAGPVQHEVLRNLAVVASLGGKVEDTRLDVHLTARDRQCAAALLANVPCGKKVVALGIGAGSASRRWPLSAYARAVSQLRRHFPLQAVILCGDAEQQEALRLARLMDAAPIILCGAPLREVCAVLQRCHLFLGNDSGPAHMAAAMNCTTIVISRHPRNGDPNHPNSPLRFAPYCSEYRVLQPVTGLDDCVTECRSRRPHCITGVSGEEVVAAALELLRHADATGVVDDPAGLPFLHASPPVPHLRDSPRAHLPIAAHSMLRNTQAEATPSS
jgi:heptosyltransferase-2